MVEDNIIIDGEFTSVDTLNLNPDVINDKTVQVVEVEDAKLFTVDTFDAFNALGEPNEQLKHQLLNGRDMSDQHPITAITGLRDELDSIEALQTIYSDKKQMADYYKWEDGNKLQRNRVGYFVSLCEDVRNIKICSGSNIFGVVIDSAAFVGGQDDITRDITYGLVLYTGVAHVRCESDVNVGDCVISNAYGMARRTNNDYGCRVIAISEVLGVKYAVVVLNLSVDQIDLMGEDLKSFGVRMDNAEKNIITAMNTANEAYNKAGNGGTASEEVIDNIMSSLQGDIDAINGNASAANTVAGEAKAIANNAMAEVEVARAEAVAIANQALSDVSGAIADLDEATQEIRDSIDNADTKAQLAVDDLTELKQEMKPLSEWKDDKGNHSFTGFVDKVDAHSATLADVAVWQGTVENGSIESIAGLKKRVSYNEAILDLVANYTKENEDGTTTDGFAGLIAQVDENGSELSTLASYEYSDENGEVISSGLSGLIQQVESNASTIKMLAGFEDDSVDSLGEIAITVNANKSAIDLLTSWQSDTSKTIASTEQIAKANQASIKQLTSADTNLQTSMTAIKQQSDENGASIEFLAASVDKYSVGEYSQSYGLTQSQANNILKDNIIYVPTINHSETFSDTNKTKEFTRSSYYMWNNGDWVEYDNTVVFFNNGVPAPSDLLQYWYVDSNKAPDGYEPHTLYTWQDEQWTKISTLTGNATNRAISMIRQTQNEIALEVTNARGDFAGLNARLEEDKEAYTQMVASVVNGDGKITGASIIAAVNDDKSSATITADHIVLNGYTSNANGSFQIDKNGYLIASGATLTGGTITIGDKFKVNNTGQLTASSATITGGTIKIGSNFEVKNTGKTYARDMVLQGSVYLYDDANEKNIEAMYAGGGVIFPSAVYFDKSATFQKDANFYRDIFLQYDTSAAGNGTSIWSGNSIYISTMGAAVHTTGHRRTIRLSHIVNEKDDDNGRLQPCLNNAMGLGSAGLKWKEVYAGTGAINTSDRNVKNNIESLTDIYEQLFMKLLPTSFTFKDGTSGRTHIGFISQDVEAAMEELGMTSLDFAGFCKDIKMKDGLNGAETEPDLDENGNIQYLYSLRYSEFIALNTHMIQKLSQRTIDLEERVAQLEELIKEK